MPRPPTPHTSPSSPGTPVLKLTRQALLGTALALLAGTGWAQAMKPGLWEHRYTLHSQSGPMAQAMADMQKQLATMPPDQRRLMEQTMASHGVGLSDKAHTLKVCITPEQAAQMDVPAQDGRCKQKVTQRTANRVTVAFQCEGEPPGQGEATLTLRSPTEYSGTAWFQTVVAGKPEKMNMSQTGRWLSLDCGNVSPLKR